MSMVVVAVGTMAVVSSLRYGDHAAMRARIDARGAQEFAKQSGWIVNYPSAEFKTALASVGNPNGVVTDVSWTTNASTKLLIPQSEKFLLPAKQAFEYSTKLTVSPPPAPGDAFVVDIVTSWESPSGAFGGPKVKTNMLEMKGVRKW